ncbi:MAG: DedA family protein [bacterium]
MKPSLIGAELKAASAQLVERSTDYLYTYNYVGVFVWLVLGSLWIPLPEEIALLFAGYQAEGSYFRLSWAIAVSVAGLLVGDNIAYWLSRHYGNKLVDRLGIRNSKWRVWIEKQFDNNAGRAVFFARFAIGMRAIGPWLAGVHKMPWIDFLFYNFLSIIVWIPLVVYVGFLFGDSGASWAEPDHLERLAGYVFIFLIVLFVIKKGYHWWVDKRG